MTETVPRVTMNKWRNVYGAEAKYKVAQIYFDGGQTDKAEQEVLNSPKN